MVTKAVRDIRRIAREVEAVEAGLGLRELGVTHEFIEGRCGHCGLAEDDYTDAVVYSGEEIMCPRPCACEACAGVLELKYLAIFSALLIGVLMLIVYVFGWRLA